MAYDVAMHERAPASIVEVLNGMSIMDMLDAIEILKLVRDA